MNTSEIIGSDPATGECRRIFVEDGRIAAIERCSVASELWIAPGLIDLQVNGYGDRDFNSDNVTAEIVIEAADLLLTTGVTSFAPTLITASEQSITRGLCAIAEATRISDRAAACIPFIHVEGPHISPLDGFRGAHPLEHVRPPSLEEFDRWQQACDGRIGMVTLSPHFEGTEQYIKGLVQRGVHASLGHTHATNEQIQCAVEAGARLSTHLGNGIAPQLPRHPNPIWSQLAEDRLTASFIADGHHLPPETLRSMLRAKGQGRAFLVSDTVALAGMPAGIYTAPVGDRVEMHADGRLSMYNSTTLAGATVPLVQCLGRAVRMTGLSLAKIIEMATTVPGSFTADRGRLEIGARADVIRFAWTDEVAIRDVWLKGEHIISAHPQANTPQ
ncbi:MAG: amidohydrolase family protein [Acidobacteria bacterium]|nr:amidohydrolase family protein [Acidobacteriota bacterium]